MTQFSPEQHGRRSGTALAVLAVFLFCLPLIVEGLSEARFDGRVGLEPPEHTHLLANQRDDLPATLLVTWNGSRVDDTRIESFRRSLLGVPGPDGVRRGGSPLIAGITTPDKFLAPLMDGGLSLDDAAGKVAGLWLGRGGLKVVVTDAGRRDVEWTAKRIRDTLAATPGRNIVVRPRSELTAPETPSDLAPAQTAYELEVFCTEGLSAAAVPADLEAVVLGVHGYATADEPNGQQLIESVHWSTGSPIAIQVLLTDAGRSEPLTAAAAIRKSAIDAGVNADDLMMTGRVLDVAERAARLQTITWSNPDQKLLPALLSPLQLSLLAGALVFLALTRGALDSVLSIAMAGFGAASFAAVLNLLNVAWNDSLFAAAALVFLLTLTASALSLSDLEDERHHEFTSTRGRWRLSHATLLSILAIAAILAASNIQTLSGRTFALLGAGGCFFAWILATVCAPAVRPLFGPPSVGRRSTALDFAHWATTHPRTAIGSAGLIAAACVMVVLQPSSQGWVAGARARMLPTKPAFRLEQSVRGTGDLDVTIRFSPESQQSLRFLERVQIVRDATNCLRSSPAVSGALSLADFAAVVEPLPNNARPKERAAYLRRSSEVESRLHEIDSNLGAGWLNSSASALAMETDAAGPMGEELWRIQAAVRTIASQSSREALAQIHLALQDVVRFHAGVTHQAEGEMSDLAGVTAPPRTRMAGILAGVAVVLAMLALNHAGLGLLTTLLSIGPSLALVIWTAFGAGPMSQPELLAIGAPVAIAMVANVRLLLVYRQTVADCGFRSDALAAAVTAAAMQGLAILTGILAAQFMATLLAPDVFGVAARLGILASIWGLAATAAILPLLLSGRLGEWVAGPAPAMPAPYEISALPVRLDSVSPKPAPHVEIDEARRRTRHAG